jgi:hypothetical protein
LQAYLITVSGTLDRREPLADINHHHKGYSLSMFVQTIQVNQKPIDDLPATIQKLIEKNAETPDSITKVSTSQPTPPPRKSGNTTTTTTTLLVESEPASQPDSVCTSPELPLPTPDQAEKHFPAETTATDATTSTSLLSQPASSVSPLPPKKRQQDTGSSDSSSQQVKPLDTNQPESPSSSISPESPSSLISQPESPSSLISQSGSKGKGVVRTLEAGEASSSSQTTHTRRKRSILKKTAPISSAKVPEDSTSTSQKQPGKRQRETDEEQEARRSARIRKQTDKPTK